MTTRKPFFKNSLMLDSFFHNSFQNQTRFLHLNRTLVIIPKILRNVSVQKYILSFESLEIQQVPRTTVRLVVKALANEDTLLRAHCCRHKRFPVCPHAQHLLWTQILCPGHKKCYWFCSETFCVRNKCFPVCAAQETSWATMWPQQCVLVYQGL